MMTLLALTRRDGLHGVQRNVQSTKTCSISWNLLHKLTIKSSWKWLSALFSLFLQLIERITIFWQNRQH